MKLIRLKLLSEFRGLAKGFEIEFTNNKINPKSIEPICLIGLNGSGKSNVLEVVSEIFYYLETFSKAKKSEIKNYKKNFGFEIEYYLSNNIFNKNKSSDQRAAKSYQIKIFVKKLLGESPIIYAYDEEFEYVNEDPEHFNTYLPEQIIAYSSGMNELISNPYIKIDFDYFEDFKELFKGKNIQHIEENRMFFMDYDANKLITICNFLFDKALQNNSDLGLVNTKIFENELKIKNLHSFSIEINLNQKYVISLPFFLSSALDNLKKCASLYEGDENTNLYRFYFYVNNATRELFKRYFKSARELFKVFYFFRLLNNHLITQETQKDVKNAKENTNISALLPKFEESKKVFNISDIAFNKYKNKHPIYYKQLSDGEHQFLHVFGTLLLMDKLGTLFLFDEPETHFNPDWRSKFVSIINDALFYEEIFREQELILTTHSPFIVSDCQKENVYIFEKDSNLKVKNPKNPKFQTFGTSIEMIYWNVFQKQQSISNVAKNELDKIETKIKSDELNKEQAIDALRKFGDSFEKMNIINILREKYPL